MKYSHFRLHTLCSCWVSPQLRGSGQVGRGVNFDILLRQRTDREEL